MKKYYLDVFYRKRGYTLGELDPTPEYRRYIETCEDPLLESIIKYQIAIKMYGMFHVVLLQLSDSCPCCIRCKDSEGNVRCSGCALPAGCVDTPWMRISGATHVLQYSFFYINEHLPYREFKGMWLAYGAALYDELNYLIMMRESKQYKLHIWP